MRRAEEESWWGEGGALQAVAWRVRKQAKTVYVDIVKTLLTGTLVT